LFLSPFFANLIGKAGFVHTTYIRMQAGALDGLRVKMCVWLGVSRGLDLAFLNAD